MKSRKTQMQQMSDYADGLYEDTQRLWAECDKARAWAKAWKRAAKQQRERFRRERNAGFGLGNTITRLTLEVEQARAELAAIKERRCETCVCLHTVGGYPDWPEWFCSYNECGIHDLKFYCRDWQARDA